MGAIEGLGRSLGLGSGWLRAWRWLLVAALVVAAMVAGAQARGGVKADGLIAFTRIPAAGSGQVYVVKADGSGLKRLSGARVGAKGVWTGYASWSPDGRRIAFGEATTTGVALVTANADGTGMRLLASTRGDLSLLTVAWSPDGKRLAFDLTCTAPTDKVCKGRPLTGGIYLVGADGRGLHRLGGVNDWFPNWSPDGKRLLFERMERRNGVHFSLYVIGADGRGLRRLSSVSAEIASAGHWGRWSPDGTRIAAVERLAACHEARRKRSERAEQFRCPVAQRLPGRCALVSGRTRARLRHHPLGFGANHGRQSR